MLHPASTTHQQLSADQLVSAGVPEDLIRLSVGLEDLEDILWDLDQALTASQEAVAGATEEFAAPTYDGAACAIPAASKGAN